MFTKLTDTSKAGIFSVLVLFMATGAALLIRFLDLTPNMGMWVLWSCTPTVAALILLLVVTREGYSKEGWKVVGLHRLGLNVWWIAFGLTLLGPGYRLGIRPDRRVRDPMVGHAPSSPVPLRRAQAGCDP